MSVKQATPKRVRVEGVPNLYQRPADGRYEVGYTGGDGRWHVKTLAARSLTDAKKELHQLLGKRDRNEDVAPQRMTLNEVADEFFAGFESKVRRASGATCRYTIPNSTNGSAQQPGGLSPMPRW